MNTSLPKTVYRLRISFARGKDNAPIEILSATPFPRFEEGDYINGEFTKYEPCVVASSPNTIIAHSEDRTELHISTDITIDRPGIFF
jgi:hypothetical protein